MLVCFTFFWSGHLKPAHHGRPWAAAHIHTHTPIHIHVYQYTHTHTHTHTHTRPPSDHLKPTMGDIELLRLFSLADEFQYMVVRDEEKVRVHTRARV